MKKVLVLGAGLVSRPGVSYLLNSPGIQVTVASRTVAKAEKLTAGNPNGRAVQVDVEDAAALARLVQEHDIAISLLPWIHHLKVADLCLAHGKHMVTTSYVSDGMKALDAAVKTKGLVFLNEIGVDPGIDHMSAMKIIDEVHARGGKIVEFFSYCGGLPAPEANDNPFGYKFSWSPRGVVLASRNSARYLQGGKVVEIPGQNLFLNPEVEEIEGLGKFEVYPNRNSVPYQDEYGIPEALTVKRGTYRNIGWCDTLKKIVDLGLVDESPRPQLTQGTFRQMMAGLLGVAATGDLRLEAARKLGIPRDHFTLANLEWLGLFSDEKVSAQNNTLDVLSDRLQEKLAFRDGERDLLVLRHRFHVEEKDGRRTTITSTLIDYGIPHGDSSMARTVSLPMAIGTRMLAEGRIPRTGVLKPMTADIYGPVLAELEKQGIRMEERQFPSA